MVFISESSSVSISVYWGTYRVLFNAVTFTRISPHVGLNAGDCCRHSRTILLSSFEYMAGRFGTLPDVIFL